MKESEFVHLGREDVPEWFTLDLIQGVDPTVLPLPLPAVPLLVLGIAEETLHHLIDVLPRCGWIDGCEERLNEYEIATKFLFDASKPWGFRGVLNPYQRPDHAGIIEYAIPIPQIEKDAGECGNCGGAGETDDGWDCFHCNKTGRETVNDWDALDCIAATLFVLGSILEMPDKKWIAGIDTGRKQLLTVRTNFERGRAFIGATLSRTFGDYLRSLSNQELPEVEAAIKSVYLHMFPSYRRFGDHDYRASIRRNGQLILDVPGNACGLYVDGFDQSLRESSGPMKLGCHNVDGHHQQLALFSGLAAFAGMARRDLYPEE